MNPQILLRGITVYKTAGLADCPSPPLSAEMRLFKGDGGVSGMVPTDRAGGIRGGAEDVCATASAAIKAKDANLSVTTVDHVITVAIAREVAL